MTEHAVLLEAARLFNDKLYFECHDLLEEAWNDARGEEQVFLKGLIEISVGLYHVAALNHVGAANLLSRGIERLEPFAPRRSGLEIVDLLKQVKRCLEKSERARDGKSVAWTPEDIPTMQLDELE